MELSNKTLAVLLLAAMVVSLGGTILSLNRMNQVQYVGYATSGQGMVNLTIEQVVSITMDDALIDFGVCSPVGGAITNITSEATENTSLVCPTFTQDNLSIRNDGNVDASVTMNSSKVGAQDNLTTTDLLLNSSSQTSSFMYKTTNASGEAPHLGGCQDADLPYTLIKEPSTHQYAICSNLTTDNDYNSVVVDFLIQMPNDAPVGQQNVTLNFGAIIAS